MTSWKLKATPYFPRRVAPGTFQTKRYAHHLSMEGQPSYYDVVVGEDVNADAAWYYPSPKAGAEAVTGRVAFCAVSSAAMSGEQRFDAIVIGAGQAGPFWARHSLPG